MSMGVEEPVRMVRSHSSDIIDRVSDSPTIITRRGKRVAAVVSMSLLERFEDLDEADLNRVIDERMGNPAPGVPLAEVMAETMARDE